MADEKAALKAQMILEEAQVLKSIPDDFLRLPTSSTAAVSPHQQVPGGLMLNGVSYQAVQQHYIPPNTRGKLQIKITSARLTKNYGAPFVRMDPYCRIRVGNVVYETPTNSSGGKNPTWNCTLSTYLPTSIDSIYLQIFDERSFTDDECVAWSRITLPPAIFNNETIDEWYPLSGRQGEGQEGVINLVMSFREIDPNVIAQQQQLMQQQMQQQVDIDDPNLIDPELAAALEASKNETGQPPAVPITDEMVSEMLAMFPTVEVDVIRAILEDKRGDKQDAATALLQLSD
uniref:Toll-interacting protein n=2 Tax=Panagrolaimus superbus TaxID=310955 RepID=A0A914Z1B7_9BILA